jgi:hypothetical protein
MEMHQVRYFLAVLTNLIFRAPQKNAMSRNHPCRGQFNYWKVNLAGNCSGVSLVARTFLSLEKWFVRILKRSTTRRSEQNNYRAT